jgi:hypothetical protein
MSRSWETSYKSPAPETLDRLLDAEQPLLSPVERSHRPMPELALMRCRALLLLLTQVALAIVCRVRFSTLRGKA